MRIRFILLLGFIYAIIGFLTVITAMLWIGVITGGGELLFTGERASASFMQENEGTEEVSPAETGAPRYEHTFRFYPDSRRFNGRTQVTVWNRTKLPTREIHLTIPILAFTHGKNPPVLPEFLTAVYPEGKRFASFTVGNLLLDGKSVPYTLNKDDLKVVLPEAWDSEEKRVISLEWEGELPMIHHRLGGEGDSFWFGNLLPTLAVYDGHWYPYTYNKVGDPFFTETSAVKVRILAPEGYTVIATGESVSKSEGEMNETIFEAENVRDFAFAIMRDHRLATLKMENGPLLSFAYQTISPARANEGLQMAARMIRYMEGLFGKYPLKGLTLFENRMFISGMEYPGFILMDGKKYKPETVAHEVAHQWFYGLVGNDQVMEPWLDEAVVTYYTNRFLYDHRLDQIYREIERNWIKEGRPKATEVDQYQTWNQYWKTTYSYGSLLFYRLEEKMGREAFDRLMQGYVKRYEGRIAHTADLIRLANEVSGEDLEPVFREHLQFK